jgi:hypothetical protein
MSLENSNDLLRKAEQALQENDRGAAGALIKRVIEQDFTNIEAWHLLHRLMDIDLPFEAFQETFAKKYYPERAHLLKQAPSEGESQSWSASSPRPKKKCPYCAEIILAEARICRFCGQDLTRGEPEKLSERREELTKILTRLEKNLASWQRHLEEQVQEENEAKRQVTWAWIGMIGGIFLVPIGIGLILVPAGFFAASGQGRRRKAAIRRQSKAREKIESIQRKIAEVKAALASFQ